jgi:hypothetical protein
MEKEGFDPKITKTMESIQSTLKPDVQHVIKDFAKDTRIIMPTE